MEQKRPAVRRAAHEEEAPEESPPAGLPLSPAQGAVDAELTAPVGTLVEKWKLLPAFLKVRAEAQGWRR